MLDWDAQFGEPARRVVEIGFGMGDSLIHMAQAIPRRTSSAWRCTVRSWAIVISILTENIQNVRVYAEDAVEVFADCLAPDSLDAVHSFFQTRGKKAASQAPLDSARFRELTLRLKPAGYLHLATDWEPMPSTCSCVGSGAGSRHHRHAAPAVPRLITVRSQNLKHGVNGGSPSSGSRVSQASALDKRRDHAV